jgi:hypothetical protein
VEVVGLVKRLLPGAIAYVVLIGGFAVLPYAYPIDRAASGDFVGHLAAYFALALGCEVLRRVVRRAIGPAPTR